MNRREAIKGIVAALPGIAAATSPHELSVDKAREVEAMLVSNDVRLLVLTVDLSLGNDVIVDAEGIRKALDDAGCQDLPFIVLCGLSAEVVEGKAAEELMRQHKAH
jgi:hypothetical protein